MYEVGDLIYLSYGTTDIAIKLLSHPTSLGLLGELGHLSQKIALLSAPAFSVPAQLCSECWEGPSPRWGMW